jgi:hypothetical protein
VGPVSTRLSLNGYLESILHKPLPQGFYGPPVHACPLRYHFIGISLVGKQQRLRPPAFLGPVFAPAENIMKQFLLIRSQRYQISFL